MRAIDLRARSVPGVEDRRDRGEELLLRILRKVGAGRDQVDAAEGVDELEEVVVRCVAVVSRASKASSSFAKSAESMPATTSPYIWISRR